MSSIIFLLLLVLVPSILCQGPPLLPLAPHDIPTDLAPPLADGRVSVHGWLWLPWVRPASTPASSPILGWFYHHTPEFYVDSPHDFEIMVAGELKLETAVAGLPFPTTADSTTLVGTEYVFTPPEFSLDQLILFNLTSFQGPFTNGSFDTTQRYTMSQAEFTIRQVTTVHYITNLTQVGYSMLPYLSYPRAPYQNSEPGQPMHLYFLHLLEASPDFDQLIHVTLDPASCQWNGGDSIFDLSAPGATFLIPNSKNNVLTRVVPTNQVVEVVLLSQTSKHTNYHTTCQIKVLEEIHCVTVPDSFANCPPVASQ